MKRGFTLIEIIIALTILGVGLISVMAYLPVALDASKRAADLTKSTFIAKGIIEKIKAASYRDIQQADGFNSAGFQVYDASVYPEFEYKVEVSPLGLAKTKDITVTIRWKNRGKILTQKYQIKIVKYNPTA